MIAAFVLAAALVCPQPGSPDLTGLWESSATTLGGIGHALEFRSDGSFVEAVTVLVDLHYQLTSGRLFLDSDPVSSSRDPLNAAVVEFHDRGLTQTYSDGSVVEKERLGGSAPGHPSIVGAWRYLHYTGSTAFELYTPDGRVLFRLPMKSSIGCYAVRGAGLELKTKESDKELGYKLRGEELMLTGATGEPAAYRRAQGGSWYDLESY